MPPVPTRLRLALLIAFALFIAAGGLSWHLLRTDGDAVEPHAHSHGVAHAQDKDDDEPQLYTCGMHPSVVQEGPGTCPICGMDLTPMRKKGKNKGKAAAADEPVRYTCGMHPSVVQDEPGTCPICGMDLTPMRKKSGGGDDAEGTVTVDPVMVQNMGVRVAPVKKGALSRRVRTIGEVVVAEDLVSVVNLKFSGWVERLHVDETGVKVRKGQPLFSVYSPELVSAQEEYLLAVRSAAGRESPLARSARARLEFWDLSEAAVRAIERRGKALRTLTIRSPRSGYVLHKNVVQGARVAAGQDLFRVGKLDAIWVHAQVYEWDAPWIRLGQKASMELSFEKGRQYQGKVSYIYPTLNTKTRTLTVRLEFQNPQLQLKPGMFTTVWIETRQRSGVLTIPTEAIIHSGERNIVFVAKDELGKYEPRQVVTGLFGDGHRTEVLSGVSEGETVVVSGQFLLDSESQLQEAMQKMLSERLQRKGGGKAVETGEVWTCPMHPSIAEDGPGQCPICGMDLVKKKVGATGDGKGAGKGKGSAGEDER